jgi:hypothetical protein
MVAQPERGGGGGENRLCPYCAVNVVPNSQRCQKMNPHLTAQYISSYRYSAQVRKTLSYRVGYVTDYWLERNARSGKPLLLRQELWRTPKSTPQPSFLRSAAHRSEEPRAALPAAAMPMQGSYVQKSGTVAGTQSLPTPMPSTHAKPEGDELRSEWGKSQPCCNPWACPVHSYHLADERAFCLPVSYSVYRRVDCRGDWRPA